MIYVDPRKLDANQLSPMDVVRAVNDSNIILPAGNIRMGQIDYPIYTNSQFRDLSSILKVPIKTVGHGRRHRWATSGRRKTLPRFSTTSSAWTGSHRSMLPSCGRVEIPTPSHW